MKNLKEVPEYMLPKNDFIFKRLFGHEGNEEITKDLVSSIIGENIRKLEFKNPYLLGDIHEDKEEILDVRVELDNNILCDIEIQVANEHNIEKRILDYWSKLYRTSIGKSADYRNMKRTIVILITTFDIDSLKGIEEYHTRWKILEEKLLIELTDVFQIDIIELSKAQKQIKEGTFKRSRRNNWIKFLINPSNMEEEEMEDLKEEIKKAYELWNDMSLSQEERDRLERRLLDLNSREYAIEYEREEARKEGRKEGREEGRKEGRKEGVAEGRKEEKVEIAKRMLGEGISIDLIRKVTGLSQEEIEKL